MPTMDQSSAKRWRKILRLDKKLQKKAPGAVSKNNHCS
jgi:hypothetical protein